MHVIAHSRIVDAQRSHPRASPSLDRWYRIMRRGRFRSFAELRAAFGTVDKVGPLMVFDIARNRYRLIAAIHFNTGRVFVRHVRTHAEYDRGNWKRREGLQ